MRYGKIFSTGLMAFISALSIAMLSRNIVFDGAYFFRDLTDTIGYISFSDAVIFVVLIFWYSKSFPAKNIMALFCSVLFSFFVVIGKSYTDWGTWDLLFGNNHQKLFACIIIMGMGILFYYILSYTFDWIINKSSNLLMSKKMHYEFIDEHFYLFGFSFLIICWLPYIIINLPGSLPYDGYRQIDMFMGISNMTNHHPYIVTLLLGSIFYVGQIINDNLGIFLIVCFNCIFSASVYTYVSRKMYWLGFRKEISIGILLFFGIVPMWGAYVQAVIKDTLYFPVFALYIVKLIEFFENIKTEQRFDLKLSIQYCCTAILVILARNNGVYIVIPTTILLIFIAVREARKCALGITLILFLTNWGYHNILLPTCSVEAGGIQEMLSIPFQQTARYVKNFGDELGSEEKEIIDKILDYDSLAKKYNPDKSDPIKDSMRKTATKEELSDYGKLYLKMLAKHPGVFLQATLNSTYGYYYPPYKCNVLLTYNYYIESKEIVATGDLDIHYLNSDSRLRKQLIAYSDFWQMAPGISFLESPGMYTWILIILLAVIVYTKNWKAMAVFAAPLLHIAICFASPVNGLLRYAMPLMAAMPIFICWTIKSVNEFGKEV